MNSKLKNEEVQKIRDISIQRIVGGDVRGRTRHIPCVFHKDHTPSLVLYPDNSFHCFGCGANGQGAIDFTMKLGYTFIEACEELLKYI